MRDRLTWLHLSDIHFRDREVFDLRSASLAVDERLRELHADGFSPDLVFITGDLAFGGKREEYPSALDLIRSTCDLLEVPPGNVYICPGNHDSDIGIAPTLQAGWEVQNQTPESTHSALLTSEGQFIRERQAAYRGCLEELGSSRRITLDATGLHVLHRFALDSLDVSVLSVNSAWLCCGGARDHGKVQVGVFGIRDLLDANRNPRAHVRLALMHHPFDWIAEFEREYLESVLLRETDLVLHGHIHVGRSSFTGRGDDRLVLLSAGAVFEGDSGRYQFSTGSLLLHERRVVVEDHIFDLRSRRWLRDSRKERVEHGLGPPSIEVLLSALHPLGMDESVRGHIAAVLSGMRGDVALESDGRPTVLSHELAFECPDCPGARIVHMRNMCSVYGEEHVEELVRSFGSDLLDYESYVRAASSGGAAFAHSLHVECEEAGGLSGARSVTRGSNTMALLRRLVAMGDAERTHFAVARAAALDEGDLAPARRMLEDWEQLAEGQDLLDLWVGAGGDLSFSVDEYRLLVQRLLATGSAERAGEVSLQCARDHGSAAAPLREVVMTVATELGNRDVYRYFLKLLGEGRDE
jgi:calcineurin-like phosphoesterase family protein